MLNISNLSDQIVAFDNMFDIASDLVRGRILGKKKDLYMLALQRLQSGYTDFGSSGWEKPRQDIDRDIDEEIADALVYMTFLVRQLLLENATYATASNMHDM